MIAIFKRDFRAFFTSMTGYVFLGAFLAIMNLFFTLSNIFEGTSYLSGLFSSMLWVVMFTIPILTMRSFAEDKKQKTDQLLLTAPVRQGHIVIGKFFSVLLVFVLTLVLTLPWLLIINIYGVPNSAEIIGNYFGMLLVAGVYISIGMFISSLTENQLIAAVGSYGVFFLLYLLDMISMSATGMPSWLVSFLTFISIFTRYGTITAGLLAFDDIMFYFSVVAMFLFFSYRVLEKRRWA